MSTPREELASALRKARLDAGFMSHGALAAEMHLNRTVITKAESSSQPVPSPAVLVAWSDATGVPRATIEDLATRCRSSTPEWFIPYMGAESKASIIRCWSPMIVPGLLQTEAYAREILSVQPFPPERLAELVRERLRRQGVLDRAHLVAVLDVGVLARRIGSAAIMAEQCAHLAAVAGRSNVAIHLVPEDVNTGCWAALDMSSRGGSATVNYSTAIDDVSSTAPEQIDKAMTAFERIMGRALTPEESLESLRTWEATWNQRT